MYDKEKIIPGLLIFVALATFPIWSSSAMGKAGDTPQLRGGGGGGAGGGGGGAWAGLLWLRRS